MAESWRNNPSERHREGGDDDQPMGQRIDLGGFAVYVRLDPRQINAVNDKIDELKKLIEVTKAEREQIAAERAQMITMAAQLKVHADRLAASVAANPVTP